MTITHTVKNNHYKPLRSGCSVSRSWRCWCRSQRWQHGPGGWPWPRPCCASSDTGGSDSPAPSGCETALPHLEMHCTHSIVYSVSLWILYFCVFYKTAGSDSPAPCGCETTLPHLVMHCTHSIVYSVLLWILYYCVFYKTARSDSPAPCGCETALPRLVMHCTHSMVHSVSLWILYYC